MSDLRYDEVHRSFGPDKHIVRGADLTCADHEYVCLLGPSGCGKSTMLRMAAGLDRPDRGDILIGGRVVTSAAPAARNVGLAFQNYALYPHLNVHENIAFPLRAPAWKGRFDASEVHRKVLDTARMLKIDHLLDRRVHALSGGQQQRVALGRALVRGPEVLLLDEPITHLDARLRYEMRGELKRLHARLGTTTLHVTHDQQEALALADRIAIMRNGRIEQIGSPHEIYRDPVSDFVAAFVGDPPMSILEGNLAWTGQDGIVDIAGLQVTLPAAVAAAARASAATRLKVGIRARDMRLSEASETSVVSGEIYSHERVGRATEITVDTSAGRARLRIEANVRVTAGEVLQLVLDPTRALFFSAENGRRIGPRSPQVSKTPALAI